MNFITGLNTFYHARNKLQFSFARLTRMLDSLPRSFNHPGRQKEQGDQFSVTLLFPLVGGIKRLL